MLKPRECWIDYRDGMSECWIWGKECRTQGWNVGTGKVWNVGMERVNDGLSSLLLEPWDEMLGQGKQNAGNGGGGGWNVEFGGWNAGVEKLNVQTGMLECTINGVSIFCWHVVL